VTSSSLMKATLKLVIKRAQRSRSGGAVYVGVEAADRIESRSPDHHAAWFADPVVAEIVFEELFEQPPPAVDAFEVPKAFVDVLIPLQPSSGSRVASSILRRLKTKPTVGHSYNTAAMRETHCGLRRSSWWRNFTSSPRQRAIVRFEVWSARDCAR
jgi:hypothetical protein